MKTAAEKTSAQKCSEGIGLFEEGFKFPETAVKRIGSGNVSSSKIRELFEFVANLWPDLREEIEEADDAITVLAGDTRVKPNHNY